MRASRLSRLSDRALARRISRIVSRSRVLTADLVAHLAEFDARRLYLEAGYSSMHAYCVEGLHLSDDAAYRRIRAARAMREFPVIGTALADGRLHLAAVSVLAPYLTGENVEALVADATHRRKCDVESMVAARFPIAGAANGSSGTGAAIGTTTAGPRTLIRAIPATELVPGRVPPAAVNALDFLTAQADPPPPEPVEGRVFEPISVGAEAAVLQPVSSPSLDMPVTGWTDVPFHAPSAPPRSEAAPPAPRFLIRFTIDARTREKLAYAHALLSHRVAENDVAEVFERALDALISQLEKQRLAATERPRRTARPGPAAPRTPSKPAGETERKPTTDAPKAPTASRARHVPAPVRRAVWRRDGGRCTFVGSSGRRCEERRWTELDHIEPVARGGQSTEDNLRLRCRAHNQREAERVFGEEFMRAKRQAASRLRQAASRLRQAAPRVSHATPQPPLGPTPRPGACATAPISPAGSP
jgi:5-methylcytosine-specific restriction endonuclease McrA